MRHFKFLFVLLYASLASAAEKHDAHEHGVGTLNIAIDATAVEIELIAPGADIVGFEHPATTQEDKKAVANAAESLEDGTSLFVFPSGAGCALVSSEVSSGLLEDGDDHDHDNSSESAEADHDDDEEHAEFVAHYRFECTDAGALSNLVVNYFDRFPAARELEARAITPDGQRAAELTGQANRLSFD